MALGVASGLVFVSGAAPVLSTTRWPGVALIDISARSHKQNDVEEHNRLTKECDASLCEMKCVLR